jgi:hypothetical protein
MRHAALPVLLLIGAIALFAGCGDDDPSTSTTAGPIIEIVDNHQASGGDHKLVISGADVVAGLDKTYDIRGDNRGHTHSVMVTAQNFSTLKIGDGVAITSSDTGAAGMDHTHDIRLSQSVSQ